MATPTKGQFVSPRLKLDMFYMYTKFGDSRFGHYGDMIAGVKIKNGSCYPDQAPFRGGLSSVSWDFI